MLFWFSMKKIHMVTIYQREIIRKSLNGGGKILRSKIYLF